MLINALGYSLDSLQHILMEELDSLHTANGYRSFPASSAFLLDACRLLIPDGWYDDVLEKLKTSGEVKNLTYLLKLRSLLTREQYVDVADPGQIVDPYDRGRFELVDFLKQHIATSDGTFTNPFGEQMPPFRIRPRNFHGTTINTDRQDKRSNNLANLLPTCSERNYSWTANEHVSCIWYAMSVTLDANRYLVKATHAYIIAEINKQSEQWHTPVLYAVLAEDSSILLEQREFHIRDFPQASNEFGVAYVNIHMPVVFQQIRGRSRRLNSFVETFRYMGKTEDTIRKWYTHEKFLRQFDECPEDWKGWDEWVWGSEEIPDCGEPTSGVELTKPRRDALHLEAKAAGRLAWYPDQIIYSPKNPPQAVRAQE
ncbi:hypothetical protein LTS08_006086 [Lithohypha guttulata]|uniref:uncharacterized protein n=1 Tax=Lithohypha guttulata TaxID=1690604 RepID=UPI002DDE02EF|nr:hypothetical protein LTS08_006086 [Lithohypha guttulata]